MSAWGLLPESDRSKFQGEGLTVLIRQQIKDVDVAVLADPIGIVGHARAATTETTSKRLATRRDPSE